MSDTPQLLALMQKTREMRAYDCVKEFESLARKLEKENIALRELTSTLGAPNHINIPVEKWRELREDKERLNWLLTYEGGSWIYWAIENGEWTPEVAASRAAIDSARKEAQP